MVESRLYLNIDKNCCMGFGGIAEQKVKNVLIKQLGFQSLVNLDPFFFFQVSDKDDFSCCVRGQLLTLATWQAEEPGEKTKKSSSKQEEAGEKQEPGSRSLWGGYTPKQ